MSSPGSRAVGPPPDPGLLSLYDRALPEVYGYLLARCGQRALAEDLTAETFLAAVRAESDGGGPTTVALADRHRPAQARRPLAPAASARNAASDCSTAASTHRGPLGRRARRPPRRSEVLEQLTAAHRAALTLRYLDDLPVPQVAALLGRTLHATEALLVRARTAFRPEYESTEQPGGAS